MTKRRELAQRDDAGHNIRLLWEEDGGRNYTVLKVDKHSRTVDPELAWHAFTHAGAYVPEAYAKVTR
jgi:hypothetical protein